MKEETLRAEKTQQVHKSDTRTDARKDSGLKTFVAPTVETKGSVDVITGFSF